MPAPAAGRCRSAARQSRPARSTPDRPRWSRGGARRRPGRPGAAFPRISSRAAPTKGGFPVRISQRIAPRPKTSHARPAGRLRRGPARGPCGPACPARCPPGKVAAAPAGAVWITLTGVSGSGVGSCRVIGNAPRGKTLARPQSITCTSPKLPTITLAGFRSR